jgi:hypothetical protein
LGKSGSGVAVTVRRVKAKYVMARLCTAGPAGLGVSGRVTASRAQARPAWQGQVRQGWEGKLRPGGRGLAWLV